MNPSACVLHRPRGPALLISSHLREHRVPAHSDVRPEPGVVPPAQSGTILVEKIVIYNRLMIGFAMAGAAIASGAVAAGYQSMSPTASWYGRCFTGLTPGVKQVALTYDDGPNDPYTFRL